VTTDDNGRIELPPLPRGTYVVTPQRVGVTVARPVTMSRDTSVHLAVITYLDIAIALGTPALIALTLLLIGRPGIIGTVTARVRSLRPRPEGEGAAP
jgi:hypothetical protein